MGSALFFLMALAHTFRLRVFCLCAKIDFKGRPRKRRAFKRSLQRGICFSHDPTIFWQTVKSKKLSIPYSINPQPENSFVWRMGKRHKSKLLSSFLFRIREIKEEGEWGLITRWQVKNAPPHHVAVLLSPSLPSPMYSRVFDNVFFFSVMRNTFCVVEG